MSINFENEMPTCLSGVTNDIFLDLTGLEVGDLDGKKVIDIGSGCSDIPVILAKQNPRGFFISLDPKFKEKLFQLQQYFIFTINYVLKKRYDKIMDGVKHNIVVGVEPDSHVKLIEKQLEIIKKYVLMGGEFFDDYKNKNVKNISRISGFGQNLPISDNSIDIVNMTCFLHGANNIDLIMNEVDRVLKDNGELIIVDRISSEKLLQYFLKSGIKTTNEKEDFFCVKLKKKDLEKLMNTIKEIGNLEDVRVEQFLDDNGVPTGLVDFGLEIGRTLNLFDNIFKS